MMGTDGVEIVWQVERCCKCSVRDGMRRNGSIDLPTCTHCAYQVLDVEVCRYNLSF